MNGWTKFFLVLLRLAIGWHFLFEGLEKIHSVNVGPTESNRPWTSRGYLRESVGPMAKYFRREAGDTDEEALELLALQPVPTGQDPARMPPRQRISPLLDQAWNEYLTRFMKHYQINPDANDEQHKLAQAKLDQAKDQAVLWILSEKPDKEIEKTFAAAIPPAVKIIESPSQRIQDYCNTVDQIRDIENNKLWAFDRDVEKQKLRTLKSEANRQRTELMADLQKPMIATLESVLTDEQKKLGPVSDKADPNRHWYEKSRMEWIDWITMYGLVAVGLGLLLGLLTRLSCLGGAVFLLLFYLSQPPFPWVPENTRTEGHYLFVNKNLIELLALLTLMTTRSGRWAGLDGLLTLLTPWGRRPARISQSEDGRVGAYSVK